MIIKYPFLQYTKSTSGRGAFCISEWSTTNTKYYQQE